MFTSTDAKSAASFSSAVAPPPALETDSLRAGAAAAAAGGPPGGGGGALVTSFSVRRSFSFEANAAFGSSASLPMATTDAPWMRAAAASSSASPAAGLTWILIVPVSPMASFTDTASPGSVLPRITSPEAPAASSRRSAASRRERKSPPPPFPSPSPFSSPPKNHFDIREKKPSSPAASPGADAVIAAVAYSVDDDGGAEGGDAAAVAASYAIAADDFCFFNDLRGAGDGAAAGAAAGAAENHDDVGCFLGGVGFVAAGAAAAGDDENQDFSADLGGAGGDDFPFALVGVAVPAGLAAARGVSFATPLAETAPFFGVTPRRPPRTRWLIAPCFRECAMSSESAPMCAAWPLAGEGARAACFASATFLECAISNESAPTCATSPRYFGGVAAREFAGTSFFCCATRYESGEPGLPFGGVGGLGTTRRGIVERWEAAICSRRRVSRPKSS